MGIPSANGALVYRSMWTSCREFVHTLGSYSLLSRLPVPLENSHMTLTGQRMASAQVDVLLTKAKVTEKIITVREFVIEACNSEATTKRKIFNKDRKYLYCSATCSPPLLDRAAMASCDKHVHSIQICGTFVSVCANSVVMLPSTRLYVSRVDISGRVWRGRGSRYVRR